MNYSSVDPGVYSRERPGGGFKTQVTSFVESRFPMDSQIYLLMFVVCGFLEFYSKFELPNAALLLNESLRHGVSFDTRLFDRRLLVGFSTFD